MSTPKWVHILLVLALLSAGTRAAVDDWHFEWPPTTSQCQSITVSITGGVPPWSLQIVPIGQQPLYWDFTAPTVPFNASYPATGTIPLQLQAGTAYVAILSDSEGYNEARGHFADRNGAVLRPANNPTTIQVVQSSDDSSCLAAASPAKKDFDFQVYGSVTQCDRSFGVTWTTTVGTAPYGCTIVPLDTSYNPWDVLLTEPGSLDDSAIWRVNMTSGTRFTVIMHDGYGTGRGGVGQIYEVASSSNVSCITQQNSGRADWPAGLQVGAVPSTTTAWGPGPTNSSTNTATDVQTASTSPSASSLPAGTSSSNKGLSTGAIAGIAAGGAVALLALLGLIFFCLRRKRRQNHAAPRGDVDLIGGSVSGIGHIEPKVEPFRSTSAGASVPAMGYARSRSPSGYESGQLVHADSRLGVHGVDTPGSVPFPTPGPGYFEHAGSSESGTGARSEVDSRSSASPYFTPLSAKAALLRGLSATSDGRAGTVSPGSGPAQEFHPSPPSSSGLSSSETKVGHLGGLSRSASPTSPHPLPPFPLGGQAPTEFRRHTDAGEVPDQAGEQGSVVDLPSLYTDVPARRTGAQQQQQQ